MLAWTSTWENKAAGCVSLPPALPCLGAPCLVSPWEEMSLWVPVSHQPLSRVQACHLPGRCAPRSPSPCCLPARTPQPPHPACYLGRGASQLVRTVGLRVGHLAFTGGFPADSAWMGVCGNSSANSRTVMLEEPPPRDLVCPPPDTARLGAKDQRGSDLPQQRTAHLDDRLQPPGHFKSRWWEAGLGGISLTWGSQ